MVPDRFSDRIVAQPSRFSAARRPPAARRGLGVPGFPPRNRRRQRESSESLRRFDSPRLLRLRTPPPALATGGNAPLTPGVAKRRGWPVKHPCKPPGPAFRAHTGAYRRCRSGRHSKGNGRQRPLGIAATEDKIVQAAVVAILTPIYEAEFLGFSYGFRPKRNQHQALDALIVPVALWGAMPSALRRPTIVPAMALAGACREPKTPRSAGIATVRCLVPKQPSRSHRADDSLWLSSPWPVRIGGGRGWAPIVLLLAICGPLAVSRPKRRVALR
jgi:hypothetical protein